MHIDDNELRKLESFIGYGSLKADYWFLGMEEGGGGDENIRARLNFKQIEDCKKAHEILGITKYHEGTRVIQRTWRGMCYSMLKLNHQNVTTEMIRDYQSQYLGRANGNTLVCELMPIPKPKISTWNYHDLIPQYKSRKEYYNAVKPNRIKLIKEPYNQYSPKVIIAYGKSYWNDYKKIFDTVKFETIKNKPFAVGTSGSTRIILTHHFVSKTMNYQLDNLTKYMKN